MTAVMGAGYEARVPAAIAASLLLHAGGLALWLYLTQKGPQTQMSVITDVDILMAQPQTQLAAAKPVASMKDFLKLALPSIPKAHAPLSVEAPEIKREIMQVPQTKIEDKGRLRDPSKLETLDLGKRKIDMAAVNQPLEERRAKPAMELPKLEEIGARRAAPKVLQMAALQEERRSRIAPQGLSAMGPSVENRRAPSAAPLLPAEASSGRRSALSKMADRLTSEAQPLKLQPSLMPGQRVQSLSSEPAAASSDKSVDLRQVKRKAVEIEGPLSNRKVAAYSIPEFPQWAKDQGVVEADVAIRFYVDPSGNVLEEMRVERTSGYGRLDRLALDHLKRWRFERLAAVTGNQWGVITFRFVLE